MAITRSTMVDDDGSLTVGTIWKNSELQKIYDNIDANTSVVTSTTTGTQTNFNPGIAGLVTICRLNNASLLTIQGITAGAFNGQVLEFYAVNAGQVDFVHNSAGATGAKLNNVVSTINTSLLAGSGPGYARFVWDSSSTLWRLTAHEQGARITFTPTIKFGGNAVGQTYVTQTAQYYVKGRAIYVSGRLTFSAKGSSTGGATIEGLPFTADATFNGVYVATYYANFASLGSGIVGYGTPGGTNINLATGGASGVSSLVDTNFTNTSDVVFGGWSLAQ